MAQAGALAELADTARRDRDWSVMSYSGFTLEHLSRHGDQDQRRLLSRLDVLVDGPYLANRHADLRWRGSDNQRIHLLTDRHAPPDSDRTAGIELQAGTDDVMWIGVPPVPGFRERFEQAMRDQGVDLGGNEPTTPSREDY
jgi:anaerobic ribonucleoside-triphosphate reductase activating protein